VNDRGRADPRETVPGRWRALATRCKPLGDRKAVLVAASYPPQGDPHSVGSGQSSRTQTPRIGIERRAEVAQKRRMGWRIRRRSFRGGRRRFSATGSPSTRRTRPAIERASPLRHSAFHDPGSGRVGPSSVGLAIEIRQPH